MKGSYPYNPEVSTMSRNSMLLAPGSVISSLSNGHLLGDEHLDTVSSMSNLALTLGGQSKLGETAAVKRDVLEKRRLFIACYSPACEIL
jgi:hypothetical protein